MQTDDHNQTHPPARLPSVWLCVMLLALFVTLWQVRCCGYLQLDLDWTYSRSKNVMTGQAIAPWQYRLLSHWIYQAMVAGVQKTGIGDAQHEALCIFRMMQNLAIFALTAFYYRKVGLDEGLVVLGLALLAFGMLHTLYFADMSFDTYSDVVFYLVAGILILCWRPVWLLVLMPLAALNRETSGLIPVMLLSYTLVCTGTAGERVKGITVSAIAMLLYAAVFMSVRHYCGPRPGMAGHGVLAAELISQNFSDEQSWLQLGATMSLVPVLAVCSLRASPVCLRVFFWALVPVWFVIHFACAAVAETRLFLVPMVLVLIPCALFGITSTLSAKQESA